MTRRDWIHGITAAMAAWPGAAVAGEFWNDKQPGEWSEKEIQRLMTKSPWAREVTPEFNFEGFGGGPGGMGGRPGGGMGGPGGPGGGPPGMGGGPPGGGGGEGGGPGGGGGFGRGGGMGGPGGGFGGDRPEIKATVVWLSAKPVLDAMKREMPAQAADFYIVRVSGLPMMGGGMGGGRRPGGPGGPGGPPPGEGGEGREGRRRPPQGEGASADMQERRQQMMDRMKDNTALVRKGKDPVHPDRIMPAPNGQGMLFFFSRKDQPITAEDKEVVFQSRMGPLEVKVKFPLKEMTYKGKLEI